jgi:hypothetical protein
LGLGLGLGPPDGGVVVGGVGEVVGLLEQLVRGKEGEGDGGDGDVGEERRYVERMKELHRL